MHAHELVDKHGEEPFSSTDISIIIMTKIMEISTGVHNPYFTDHNYSGKMSLS